MERDRLDGLISDEISGLMDLDELGMRTTVVKTPVVVSDDPSRAFSKSTNDAAFVRAFDQALQSMLADGRYRDIAQRKPCPVSIEKVGCVGAAQSAWCLTGLARLARYRLVGGSGDQIVQEHPARGHELVLGRAA